MEVPLEIGFHNVEKSDWMEDAIRERAAGLDQLYDRLTAVRVRVEMPHKSQRTGNLFEVHVEMSVPGDNLVVSHAPHHPEERYAAAAPELGQVIREAFDIAERQLLKYKEKLGGDVKTHEGPAVGGQISILESDHGFILTNTGAQLYFHRNSVVGDDFDDFRRGDHVNFVETVGDTGPIANKVKRAGGQSPA